MNPLLLLFIGLAIALLVVLWLSRWIKGIGDGVGMLCILAATPSIVIHDRMMEAINFTWKFFPHLHWNKEELQSVGVHDLVYSFVGDSVAALVGVVILAGDTQIAYVFNPSLFGTHEVSFSSTVFEWGASLLWVAVPAMFGIVAFDCFGIGKSSDLYGKRRVIRILLGIAPLILMGLAVGLVMYAYSYRGVNIFDASNKDMQRQMGESILPLLGLLIAAASFPAFLAVGKGIATVLTLLLLLILGVVWCIAELVYSPAILLNIYALFCTGWQRGVFITVRTQDTVDVLSDSFGNHATSQTAYPLYIPASSSQFTLAPPSNQHINTSRPFPPVEVVVPGVNGNGDTLQKKA